MLFHNLYVRDTVMCNELYDNILTHWGRDKWPTFRRRFKGISVLNENIWISIYTSLKFVPKGPINNIAALVQTMVWRRPCDKPLSEPMIVNLPTHICVTRPQWVKSQTKWMPFTDDIVRCIFLTGNVHILIWISINFALYVQIKSHNCYETKKSSVLVMAWCLPCVERIMTQFICECKWIRITRPQ